jgi:hypothetical protein
MNGMARAIVGQSHRNQPLRSAIAFRLVDDLQQPAYIAVHTTSFGKRHGLAHRVERMEASGFIRRFKAAVVPTGT